VQQAKLGCGVAASFWLHGPPSALSLSMRSWPALKFDRGYCLARAVECERQAFDNLILFLRDVLLSLAEKWRQAAEESNVATANSQKQ
jgi:hypothetical protein